jgi:hypothetical protein
MEEAHIKAIYDATKKYYQVPRTHAKIKPTAMRRDLNVTFLRTTSIYTDLPGWLLLLLWDENRMPARILLRRKLGGARN